MRTFGEDVTWREPERAVKPDSFAITMSTANL